MSSFVAIKLDMDSIVGKLRWMRYTVRIMRLKNYVIFPNAIGRGRRFDP